MADFTRAGQDRQRQATSVLPDEFGAAARRGRGRPRARPKAGNEPNQKVFDAAGALLGVRDAPWPRPGGASGQKLVTGGTSGFSNAMWQTNWMPRRAAAAAGDATGKKARNRRDQPPGWIIPFATGRMRLADERERTLNCSSMSQRRRIHSSVRTAELPRDIRRHGITVAQRRRRVRGACRALCAHHNRRARCRNRRVCCRPRISCD